MSDGGERAKRPAREARRARRSGSAGDAPRLEAPLAVVGAGASAGGLTALQEFFAALPRDTGMAFVLVPHLAPAHESHMTEILQRSTSMPVRRIEQDVRVEPDHVYVIPPAKTLVLSSGHLRLSPRVEASQHRPIDHFLHSLADEMGPKAIGIILSGTANDGTRGLEEIKAAGGITFAQDGTAEQEGMPQSAVDSGCVDFVLPPAEIAREIGRISRHPFVGPPQSDAPSSDHAFQEILTILRRATGVDFTHYKASTLHRRLTRRVVLHKLDSLDGYIQMLRRDPAEIDALYHDILISVTSFFRNPEAFEVLKAEVFPRLLHKRARHDPIRVWVPGCSTGEEPYSLAMALMEYADAASVRASMQVFATDLNATAIERARGAVYPKSIAEDVSPDRLRRFFVELDGSYRITKSIREMCVFARHDVLKDPPFSRLDLVACRNMMIYLEPVLQEQLIPVLHYALRSGGYLWLGSSETIGQYHQLFELKDPRNKIYVKRSGTSSVTIPTPMLEPHAASGHAGRPRGEPRAPPDPLKVADRLLLARYAPPCLVVDAHLDIVHLRGNTTAYLTPAPGRPSTNLMKMLRPELAIPVRAVVQRALHEKVTVRQEGLRLTSEGRLREITLVVVPLENEDSASGCLVLFEEPLHSAEARLHSIEAEIRASEQSRERAGDPGAEVQRLQQELASTREYLQSVIEQQEAANEELESANEEVQSANEELQSINEELETSKEEIQASNEELATVNEELQNRNLDLSQANNDTTNLVSSVQMAIVMLGPDLRIRRFTPTAEPLLNLHPSDLGRSLSEVKLGLDLPDVEALALRSMTEASTQQLDVQTPEGHWYWLRMRPYRTVENRIEGVVLVFVDIDSLKRAENALRESEARFELLADNAPVLIWVSGLDGVQSVNRAYEEFVGAPETEILHFGWTQYLHPDDRNGYAGDYLDACARRAPFERVFRCRRADGVYRWMKSVGAPRFMEQEFLGYVGCTYDITESKEAQQLLVDVHRSKDEFLATLAHELRNPLAAMSSAVHLLGEHGSEEAAHPRALHVLERQMGHMVRMVDDLLDVSRINHGKIQLQREPMDLATSLRYAVTATEEQRQRRSQRVSVELPGHPLMMLGDPARLEQVFSNVLVNASKFTPDRGNAWVSLEREGDWGVVRIRDDGEGIAPQNLHRVFDLFVQAHSDANAGAGIGLTLSKRLVELHGGTIEARSPGRGEGAEFVIRLPLDGSLDAGASHRKQRAAVSSEEGCRVLVVDDNSDLAEMQAAVLKDAGHTVRTAHDGPSAVEAARDFDPEVTVLDIGLPGEDGCQVAARLREELELRDMLLIALTGYGQESDAARCRAAGFDAHLTKPADQAQLLERIADWARARRRS